MGRPIALMLGLWLAGFVTGPSLSPAYAEEPPEAEAIVFVISNGWHTGLVLARDDVPPGRIPEAAAMANATFLEFGWGDREYYPHPRPTLDMALAAALTPSPAVIHLAGLSGPPSEVHPSMEIIAVELSKENMAVLVDALDATFDRPPTGPAEPVAAGLYRDSWFYPARGRFHLFNTCNTWIARLLSEAGVAISPAGVITAEDLMSRLRGPDERPRGRPAADR